MRRVLSRYQVRPGEWALLAALLACFPLSLILPPALASEANLLENLQVLVLLGGFALAMVVFLRQRPARSAMLALWVAPVWLLLAGRELSWGRAWRAAPLDPLPLQPLVWPAAALLIGWLVYSAWHYRLDQVVRSALAHRTSWVIVLVALGAAMGSTCAEGHMSCHLDTVLPQPQLFEELAELLAYVALCNLQAVVLAHRVPFLQRPVGHRVDARVEEGR